MLSTQTLVTSLQKITELTSKLSATQRFVIYKLLQTAVMLIIVAQCIRISWLMLYPHQDQLQQITPNAPTASAPDIGQWTIFGPSPVVVSKKKAPSSGEIYAKKTNLPLLLLGLFFVQVEEKARALIQVGSNPKAKRYAVGDNVQGSTIIASIHEDRVMLNTDGTLSVLRFKKKELNIQQTNQDKPSTSASTEKVQHQLPDELKALGLKPFSDGYKLISKTSPLLQIGIKVGDIIISINGQTTLGLSKTEIQAATDRLIDEIRISRFVELEVKRNDQIKVISRHF